MFNQIKEIALKALLYEVAATPKPGLVDRNGNGAHKDMDYFTFMDSTISLQTYFEEIGLKIKEIYHNTDKVLLNATHVFDKIKLLGINAEFKMLHATKGVNTHKGAIYSLGLLVSAACEIELIYGLENVFALDRIDILTRRVSEYIFPNLASEFNHGGQYKNYGVKQFIELGLLGARGEAASGFYHAKAVGLPEFEKCIVSGMSLNDSLIHALLKIITVLEDSNVIGRSNQNILYQSQNKAVHVLELGGMQTAEGIMAMENYCKWCVCENISHGGSADMLVITIFLYLVKNNF